MTCNWTGGFGGGRFPCISHGGDAHHFEDGYSMPLAVTGVTYPPHRRIPLSECLDVAEVLARHGLTPDPS